MSSRDRAELEGTILDNKYRLGEPIGFGGTGVIFAAERVVDGDPVVVKTLRPSFAERSDLCVRMMREAEVARAVPHAGVVPVYDTGALPDGTPYLVMRWVYGEPLLDLLRRERKLSVAEACVISMRVADILQRVHGFGYIHRDVKPEHVLLRRTGQGNLSVMLLDFGVCASERAPLEEKLAEKGRVYGTPSYCSPEQASGNPFLDGRSDAFGLGVVMFEMLCGRTPFRGKDVTALLRRIIREDAPRLSMVAPRVPRALDEIVADMLARDVNRRPDSMRAIAHRLSEFVRNRTGVERGIAARLRYHAPHFLNAEETATGTSAVA